MHKVKNHLWHAVSILPLAIPTALAVFGIVSVILLLLGQFRNELVWPLGLVTAAIAVIVVSRYASADRPGSIKEQRLCDFLIIIGVLTWIGFNFFYTSQHVLTNRDPATYAVAAQWLTKQDNLQIPIPEIAGDVSGVTANSGGFVAKFEHIHAQGLHMLPALLGLIARAVGNHYLHFSVLFGGTALLALYAFGRMLAPPRWAVLTTAAFALTLPLIYFSRDTYTEPLTATFVFSGLALLWHAQITRRPILWFLSGLTIGASALTRIDSYLLFIGLAAFAAIYLAVALRGERKQAIKNVALLGVGGGITGLMGWLDTSLLSAAYYDHIRPLFLKEIAATATVVLFGGLGVWLVWKKRTMIARWEAKTRRWRPAIAAAAILIAGLLLYSRPILNTHYQTITDEGFGESSLALVLFLQESAGLPVEPRTYSELAPQWVVWYLGPLLAILGIVGIALAAAKASTNRKLLLVPGLLAIASMAVYLANPSITPDQVWASRRLLPVILPGVAIFAVIALDHLYRRHLARVKYKHLFMAILAAALLVGPLLVTHPFLRQRDSLHLDVITTTCDRLPDDAAVLWVGSGRFTAIQPTQAFCDVPSVGFIDNNLAEPRSPTKEALSAFASTAHERGLTPIIALYSSDVELIDKEEDDLYRTGIVGYKEVEQTLIRPPENMVQRYISILLGEIDTDGNVVKYESRNTAPTRIDSGD